MNGGIEVFRYTLRRFLYMVITLFIIASLTFFLMHALPGDPFANSEKLPAELKEALMQQYNLDKPLVTQYGLYLGKLIKGDLGISFKYQNRSVNKIIKEAFPVSATIGMQGLIFGIFLGLGLGILAAIRHNTIFDYGTMAIAIIGVSIPAFVFATLLQYYIGLKLGWFPIARWGTFSHTIMPSFALSLGIIALMARMMRTSMLDVLSQDYLKTAKSKGLSGPIVIWRHAIRNALLPIVTILGPLIINVITGTLIIEQIFAIPGLGKHFVQSIVVNDYTVTMGLAMFYSAFLVVAIFLVDIAYGIVDPRIRLDGGKG
jgi:ABC-type dipeptide/oligopeptide/nickel transport system permease component